MSLSSWNAKCFTQNVAEQIKTHILCSITSFENRAFYGIMWENNVEPGKPHTTIWRMRIACCPTHARSGYV